jgi:PEP-CTERM motif
MNDKSCSLVRAACSFTRRATLPALFVIAAFALNTTAIAYSTAASVPATGSTAGSNGSLPGSLWYNGDLNHVNGLANERDDGLGFGQYAHVFDDFNVTDSTGWHLTSLYSNNYMSYIESGGPTTAVEWSIHQGITEGNPGTTVASGTSTDFAITIHDEGFTFTEYTVQVLGLNINLAPGTYFLNVTPVGSGHGRSFTTDTSGAGCIGTPCGNNGNAFFDSNFFGANYQSTAEQGQPGDFSMGVIGTVVPEPATVALLTCGLGALLIALRRRGAA